MGAKESETIGLSAREPIVRMRPRDRLFAYPLPSAVSLGFVGTEGESCDRLEANGPDQWLEEGDGRQRTGVLEG